jgi:hypothetical protein
MSIDLHDVFAHAGQDAPPSSVDADLVVHQGRRLRARRRRVAATGLLLGVGALAFASAAVATNLPLGEGPGVAGGPAAEGSAAPTASASLNVPPSSTPSASARTPSASVSSPPGPPAGTQLRPDRAGLQSVTLADPAPGFPVRRAADGLEQMPMGEGGATVWVRSFLLATAPAAETTDAAGNVSGTPTGPEVTVFVGALAKVRPDLDGTIDGAPLVASPAVAGVVGYLTQDAEKGTPRTTLYFSNGAFRVEIHGFGDVAQQQLVDLGNAIEGLPQP